MSDQGVIMSHIKSGLLVFVFLLPLHAFAAGADTLIEGCGDCHGAGGVSSESDIPTIAGQAAEYLSDSLAAYQDWGRPCIKSAYRHGDVTRAQTTMCAVSEGLTDNDIEAVSQYFASQKFIPAQQEFDAVMAETGSDLHEIYCETCHKMGGNIAGRGPLLAGQWAPYLETAIRQASGGEHLVPPAMEKRLLDFTKEEIDALVNFYASQQDIHN
jgi:sulfide dehydrogenase cytochrome subunit